MADLTDRQLPWRMKDGWTSTRVESEVEVAVLENDAVQWFRPPFRRRFASRLTACFRHRCQHHAVPCDSVTCAVRCYVVIGALPVLQWGLQARGRDRDSPA